MSFPVKQHCLLRHSRGPRVWSVRFKSASHIGIREDDAKGLVAGVSIGGGAVRNDFDRLPIFQRPVFNATWDRAERRWIRLVPQGAPGFSWSPTEPYREVVYRCQPFWYQIEADGAYPPSRISVTDRPLPGYTLAPMFKNGKDFVYRPSFEMGLGEDGLPHSRAGLSPRLAPLPTLMAHAQQYDASARTESVLDWFSDALLMLVEFATWNFSDLMRGNTTGSVHATGEALPLVAASSGTVENGTPCTWRGKENPWKNACSALCDIYLKKVSDGGGKRLLVCHLPDMTRFTGELNEHYLEVGSYMITTGVQEIGGFGFGQGFMYPKQTKPAGVGYKGTAYSFADYNGARPVAAAVGGNSQTAMMPVMYLPSPLNWETVDLSNWRAGYLGARLVLDEGGAR